MADYYMVQPTECSPAAGWENGQVEHQVQTIRGHVFQPRLRFASLEELNGWAMMLQNPVHKEMTVAQALEMERRALQPMLAPFDGFHETQHAVTGTCLISFDRNCYSAAAKAARRAVQIRAYADRIVVRMGDEVIADHPPFLGSRPNDLRPLALSAGAGGQAWRCAGIQPGSSDSAKPE